MGICYPNQNWYYLLANQFVRFSVHQDPTATYDQRCEIWIGKLSSKFPSFVGSFKDGDTGSIYGFPSDDGVVVVIGYNKKGDEDWKTSEQRICEVQNELMAVEFDDGFGDRDFDDLRVYLRRYYDGAFSKPRSEKNLGKYFSTEFRREVREVIKQERQGKN